MNVTRSMTRPAWLATVLIPLLAASALASAQEKPREARLNRLPVSVSLPLFLAWAKEASLGVTSGVTLSTQISAPLAIGLTLRGWSGYAREQSCALNGDCFWQQETSALVFLTHTEFYPLPDRLLFVRGAVGISWLREQEALGNVIHESRVWPFTLLTAVGWDLRVKDHLFVTPLVELLATPRHEPAARTSPQWFVQTGVALTIR